jgi:hypothetical protein
MKILLRTLMIAGLLAASAGCGDGAQSAAEDTNGLGGKADAEQGDAPCVVLSEEGGALDLSQRNDVLANAVLKTGTTCPTTYAEVMAKLRVNDADDSACKVENPKGGINSMVVSETAQLLKDENQGMRVVVTRKCNGRQQHELFFSLFGVSNGRPLPGSVEVMAFDNETEQYNYYALEGGEWTFFGTSLDLVQPGAKDTKRCAGCHTGGGPIMKELDTPWNHWEGHEDVPGARTLVDANEDLGTKSSGSRMESLVKEGNRVWNKTRVKAMAAGGDIHQLLRPLFCSVEVNLDNGSDFRSSELKSVKLDLLIDPKLKGFGSIPATEEDYQAILTDVDQIMSHNGQSPIIDAEGNTLRDTIFRLIYPERAFADMDYGDKLKDAGIIDDDFIKDVLIIDFTRPLYSEIRCGLLGAMPQTLDVELNPANIKAAVIAALEGSEEGTPAAELLANLKNEDPAAHDATVNTFIEACKARDKKAFLEDSVLIAIQRRDLARGEFHHSLFEFPQAMPFAGIEVGPETHLDPVSCELVDDTSDVTSP